MKALIALFICSIAAAQSVVPAPSPEIQYVDQFGAPLAGAKLCSYIATTNTPTVTYRDTTPTANTNPVILDSAGRASVWLGPLAYKLVLRTGGDASCSSGTVVWTQDNVPGALGGSIVIASGQSLTLQAGSTFSAATNLVPSGSRTLGTTMDPWATLNVIAINMNGDIEEGSNNLHEIGHIDRAFATSYVVNPFANVVSICGLNGGVLDASLCWTLTPTVDANNSYLTLTDEGGNVVWAWDQKHAGFATNIAIAHYPILPITNNTLDLGITGARWRNGWFGGTVTADQLNGTDAIIDGFVVDGGAHTDTIASGSTLVIAAGAGTKAPNGSAGLTQAINVRKSDNSGACTITVSAGLITATTCP